MENTGVDLYRGSTHTWVNMVVRRTLYELYSPYFLAEVIVKFTRMAIGSLCELRTESGIYLISCISRLS